jgi:hypothetical protein
MIAEGNLPKPTKTQSLLVQDNNAKLHWGFVQKRKDYDRVHLYKSCKTEYMASSKTSRPAGTITGSESSWHFSVSSLGYEVETITSTRSSATNGSIWRPSWCERSAGAKSIPRYSAKTILVLSMVGTLLRETKMFLGLKWLFHYAANQREHGNEPCIEVAVF